MHTAFQIPSHDLSQNAVLDQRNGRGRKQGFLKFSVDSKLAVFNCSQFPFSESATYNFKNLISVLVLSPSANLARSTVNREVMPIPLTHATDEKLDSSTRNTVIRIDRLRSSIR